MARLAYFDCFSGISGDMILGALVDAGLELDRLGEELAGLGISGYRLTSERVQRAGITATRVHVNLAAEHQPVRHLSEILEIIAGSGLPAEDRRRGSLVFQHLAEAEAAVHGVSPEEVHFHEVGAVDAIVDILGTIAGLRLLAIDECYASPLPVGSGTVRSGHGELPVPAPATLELLARARAPLRSEAGERGELVTPTGAALLTTLARFGRPALRLERVGYGAGGRDPAERPNVLRLWMGEGEPQPAGRLIEMETNIDDMPAEFFGYVQERLFDAGALDVWFTPIQMKKNRPAVLLSLVCRQSAEDVLVGVLLRETSTLGVRQHNVERHEAERESVRFPSSLGEAAVKVKRLAGERARVAPEYESCREIALRTGIALPDVYRTVAGEAEAWLNTREATRQEKWEKRP